MNKDSKRSASTASSGSLPPLPTVWLGIFAVASTTSMFLGLFLGYLFFSGETSEEVAEKGSTQSVDSEKVEVTDPSDPKQRIQSSIQEAISMIDKDSQTLLAHGLFPVEAARNLEERAARNSRRSKNGSRIFEDKELDQLKWHLESSLQGEYTFNRENTIAEIKYKLIVPEEPEFRLPEKLPKADRQPRKRPPGLGNNLQEMLTKAAALVENDQLEEFVNNVYPLAMVASLEEGDAMKRHLVRIRSSKMKNAMIDDLTEATKAEAKIQGDLATIALPPLVQDDPAREIQFELINGNWRFIDSNKQERAERVRLASLPPATINIEDEFGTIVMNLTEQGWRLSSAAFMMK